MRLNRAAKYFRLGLAVLTLLGTFVAPGQASADAKIGSAVPIVDIDDNGLMDPWNPKPARKPTKNEAVETQLPFDSSLAKTIAKSWIIVPAVVGQDDLQWAKNHHEAIKRALEEHREHAIPLLDQATAYQFKIGDPLPELIPSDIADWMKTYRRAMVMVTQGDLRPARQLLSANENFLQQNFVVLNRNAQNANQLLDDCLLRVRINIEQNDNQLAKVQAQKCSYYSGGSEAPVMRHPPEVIALYRAAVAEANEQERYSLSIYSSEKACIVRVNGFALGPAPVRLIRSPGVYYVQLECDSKTPALARKVNLNNKSVEVLFNPALAAITLNRPILHLRYATLAQLRVNLERDLLGIAEFLKAYGVIGLERRPDAKLALLIVRPGFEVQKFLINDVPDLSTSADFHNAMNSFIDSTRGSPRVRSQTPDN